MSDTLVAGLRKVKKNITQLLYLYHKILVIQRTRSM